MTTITKARSLTGLCSFATTTTMNHPIALWRACPAPDGEHWLPWDLYQITPLCSDIDPAKWRREAHRWAREDRKAWPGHLIAVRPYEAGPPLPVEGMLDDYDLPPYV